MKLQAVKGVRRLVLVDGVFAPKLSDTGWAGEGASPSAPCARCWKPAMPRCRRNCSRPITPIPMVALNSAMMTDGVVIEIADGIVLTQPLQIVHVASGAAPAAMFTRSLLRLGKDAGATLVESYIAADGAKAYQAHDSLIVAIGDNSRLDKDGFLGTSFTC